MMTKLVENGMNIIRLNFSHGDYAEHLGRLEILKLWSTKDEDREEGAKLLNVLAKKIS